MKRELIVTKRGVLVLTVISFLVALYSLKSFYSLNINRGSGISNLQRIYNIQSSNAKLKLKLSNARYHYLITNYEDSIKSYIHTIELNPVLVKAWIGISELLIDEKKNNEAFSILQNLKNNNPHANKLHWDISLLLIKINEYDLAVKTLINVAENNIWKRSDIFRVFDKLQIDKKVLIDKLKNTNLMSSYLDHLLSNRLVNESTYLWDFMANNNIAVDTNVIDKYIEFLINNDLFNEAYSIWIEGVSDANSDNLIWNGDFEFDIENSGFNWRIRSLSEVDISIDTENFFTGNKSLKIEFNGKKNINFNHIKKHIPIDEGSNYSLSYTYSSKDITTKSGVFWELRCNDNKLLAKSDMIVGSSKWVKNKIEFSTGKDCKGMSLILKRIPIRKLDSKISGTVWFDDFRLNTLN